MTTIKKLLRASALAGMMLLSAAQLAAERIVDEGKNFTVSNSPETTVFNLKTPSGNRHIHEYNRPIAVKVKSVPVADCEPGMISDEIDNYHVRLEKSAPDMVALNVPYSYQYTVLAKDDINKVVVEEQIPAGVVYVSSEPQAEVSGRTVTWTLYNLEDGAEIPLSLVVKPTALSELHSCATVIAYPEACLTTSVGAPELSIVKTAPSEQVLINGAVPWDITVTNTGNFCAYDVVVTDSLPAGMMHASGTRQLVTEIGTLAPGESREITVNSTATAAGRAL